MPWGQPGLGGCLHLVQGTLCGCQHGGTMDGWVACSPLVWKKNCISQLTASILYLWLASISHELFGWDIFWTTSSKLEMRQSTIIYISHDIPWFGSMAIMASPGTLESPREGTAQIRPWRCQLRAETLGIGTMDSCRNHLEMWFKYLLKYFKFSMVYFFGYHMISYGIWYYNILYNRMYSCICWSVSWRFW